MSSKKVYICLSILPLPRKAFFKEFTIPSTTALIFQAREL
jgi:hypothetical protein